MINQEVIVVTVRETVVNAQVALGMPGPSGAVGPVGPKGDPGASGTYDPRIALIGDTMSQGVSGVEIAVSGMSSPNDYVTMLSYLENPGYNGTPWAEQQTDKFVLKHYGPTSVKVGYTVYKKVA